MPLSKSIKDRIMAMFKLTVNDETAVRIAFADPPEGIPVDPLVGRTMTRKVKKFENVGSVDQNVDGSITPVNFQIDIPVGEIWILDYVTVWLADLGTFTFTNFGAISGLTNGWVLEKQINGVVEEIVNLQNNPDSGFFFSNSNFVTQLAVGNENVVVGNHHFNDNVNFIGSVLGTDFLRWQVRDDLTGLTNLASHLFYWEIT